MIFVKNFGEGKHKRHRNFRNRSMILQEHKFKHLFVEIIQINVGKSQKFSLWN